MALFTPHSISEYRKTMLSEAEGELTPMTQKRKYCINLVPLILHKYVPFALVSCLFNTGKFLSSKKHLITEWERGNRAMLALWISGQICVCHAFTPSVMVIIWEASGRHHSLWCVCWLPALWRSALPGVSHRGLRHGARNRGGNTEPDWLRGTVDVRSATVQMCTFRDEKP